MTTTYPSTTIPVTHHPRTPLPCLPDAGWGLQPDVVPDPRLQAHTHKPYKVDRIAPTECPCMGAIVHLSMWNAEDLTPTDRKKIRLVTSYLE